MVYTSDDFRVYAANCGYACDPFKFDEERRFIIRCEMDAAFFHLYLPSDLTGHWNTLNRDENRSQKYLLDPISETAKHFSTPRDAVDYIMDTFPIVKRKDEKTFGEYRTKKTILEIYDAMAEAKKSGSAYQTRLDPPPGDERAAHKKE